MPDLWGESRSRRDYGPACEGCCDQFTVIENGRLLPCPTCRPDEHDAEARTPPAMFADGDPSGCVCGPDCEMPCWQRVGLTDRACCPGCEPLPAVEDAA